MRTKKILKLIIAILISGCMGSCDKEEILESKSGFPENATNLSMFNSKYDDYNSDMAPGEYDMFPLIFSSNRNSKGKNFDLNMFSVGLSYPFEKDVVSIGESAGITYTHSNLNEIMAAVNTAENQFGPYLYYLPESTDVHHEELVFFYAQGDQDKLDIQYWLHELVDEPTIHNRYKWSGPFELKSINTGQFSEGYISIQGDQIYYCSNCTGNYEIYQKEIPSDVAIQEFLKAENKNDMNPVAELNSNADDKCPYMLDDFMVFASNRAGGFGGYDLWYSKRINGQWEEPQNFGSNINSEFDEYRPIVRKYENISNDMMIFSSNRKGGLGGFDLYYVGITETK